MKKDKIILPIIFALTLAQSFAADVTVAWDSNSEPDLEGYYIYYGTNSMDRVRIGKQTRVTLSDLVAGVPYTIYATAYNTAGVESEPSESIRYTPPLIPTVPTMGMEFQGGQIAVSGSALPSQSILLQATTALSPAEWVTVQTITPGADGTVRVPLTEHLLNPRRFYRLSIAP